MEESNDCFNQQQRPLFAALKRHQEEEKISFHVPGHKNGLNWQGEMATFRDILKLDQTEVSGLDYLHEAEGVLRASQDLLADFYRSSQSYYLVNGSTVGNLAMILGATTRGGTVFVDRNVHQSVIHALELNELNPIFLAPEMNLETQEAEGISLATLKAAFMCYPKVEAMILTYPTYHGGIYPLQELIQLAKSYRCLTLIDEAHGAHFVLAETDSRFPVSALDCGADVVVQSAHKMLPALTQAAYLHCGHSLPDTVKKRIEHYLHMLQSSSPSYLLMLSLEYARWFLANLTAADVETSFQVVESWKNWFIKEGLLVQTCSDPLKLMLSSHSLSGNELSQLLEARGLFPELADSEKVLLTFPLLKVEEAMMFQPVDLDPLLFSKESVEKVCLEYAKVNYTSLSELAIGYEKQSGLDREVIPLKDCLHRVSGANVTPYPPGVPLLVNGERIEARHLDLLLDWYNQGARIVGLNENGHISVFCE